MPNIIVISIIVLAFGSVTLAAFSIGQYLATQARLRQRSASRSDRTIAASRFSGGIGTLVSSYIDEKRFGIEGGDRTKLRQNMIRAGFFHPNAIKYYIFFRIALVIVLPVVVYLLAAHVLVGSSWLIKMLLTVIAAFLAIIGPDAYLARRRRILVQKYRIVFPDMLDLLIVCVDAGLSLNAAFERISGEFMHANREFGMNLMLMGAEVRAGRSQSDALVAFADRLGLDEARAFVATLHQSIELGSDIGETLRVSSDEMRDRRLLRAEEKANELPVKMVLPLGAFIFPVILLLVLYPVVLRLMTVLGNR